MTRWRERIGPGGMEVLLKATIAAGLDGGVVAAKELERVTLDTTVQPKAVTHPSDARLYHRGREILVRLATKHGLVLRQSLTPHRTCRSPNALERCWFWMTRQA
jgi:IS5 family transposase